MANGLSLPAAFGLHFTQAEVDFVIPNLLADVPVRIDPFLLYKSKDPTIRELHCQMLDIFKQGIQLYRDGKRRELDRLINFPEVREIGFGLSEGHSRGSGLGVRLNSLLADTLATSVPLQERGLRHVEELQLLSPKIGPDRISDIVGNILKGFLIDYTQRQAELWHIPLTAGMPIEHYFDFEDGSWSDGYFDLPRNPTTGDPILLVPRRIVRLLLWINYEDYVRTDFKMFLSPGQRRNMPSTQKSPKTPPQKEQVTQTTREKLDLLDRYVGRKERQANQVEPTLQVDQVAASDHYEAGETLISRLEHLPPGTEHARDYEHLVLEILNYLFLPELTDGKLQVSTYLETERRDIIFINEAEKSFWSYVRSKYSSFLVMFEAKTGFWATSLVRI